MLIRPQVQVEEAGKYNNIATTVHVSCDRHVCQEYGHNKYFFEVVVVQGNNKVFLCVK